jgi:hypothetical protein
MTINKTMGDSLQNTICCSGNAVLQLSSTKTYHVLRQSHIRNCKFKCGESIDIVDMDQKVGKNANEEAQLRIANASED